MANYQLESINNILRQMEVWSVSIRIIIIEVITLRFPHFFLNSAFLSKQSKLHFCSSITLFCVQMYFCAHA